MNTLSQHDSVAETDEPRRTDSRSQHQAVIGVFDTHAQAEGSILKLQEQGYPIEALTLVGKGYHSEERPLGLYTIGDRVKAWGGTGLIVGAVWGLMFGAAFFWFPEFTAVGFADPVLDLFAASAEGAIAVGLITALGAALFGLLLPRRAVIRYQGSVKADRFLLMAQGDETQIETARRLMEQLLVDEQQAIQV
ncbi:MAG: hypothetical protein ABW101_10585 [Candidatus Thiodiazotropha sp.]